MKQQFYNYRWLLILVLFVLSDQISWAQTVLFDQQWYSRINRNPAAATSGQGDFNFGLLYRNQWAGIDGSPKTLLFNADKYVEKIQAGFGLTVQYDQYGQSTSSTNALASYAYRIRLGEEWKLSLGLGVGIMYFSKDPTRDHFADPTDDNLATMEHINQTNVDINIGGELAYRNFMVGIAVDHVLDNNAGTTIAPKTPREYFLYSRYNFDLRQSFELAPQIGYGYMAGENIFEVGATAIYKKAYWVGANWRVNNIAAFMLGVSISDIRIGYAYELGLADVGALSKNTHEIMLLFSIGKKK